MGLLFAILLGYGFLFSIGFLIFRVVKQSSVIEPLITMGIILLCCGGLFFALYTDLLPSGDVKKVMARVGLPIEDTAVQPLSSSGFDKEKAYSKALNSMDKNQDIAGKNFETVVYKLKDNKSLQSTKKWQDEVRDAINQLNNAYLPMTEYPENDVPEKYKEFHKIFLEFAEQSIHANTLSLEGILNNDPSKREEGSNLLLKANQYLDEKMKHVEKPGSTY